MLKYLFVPLTCTDPFLPVPVPVLSLVVISAVCKLPPPHPRRQRHHRSFVVMAIISIHPRVLSLSTLLSQSCPGGYKLWHVYEFVMDEMFPLRGWSSTAAAAEESACNKHNSFLWANKEHNNNTKPAFNADEHNLSLSRLHL